MRATTGSATSPSRLVRGFRRLRVFRRLPVWARYLVTAALVGATAMVRGSLAEYLHGFPFLLFFPVIVLCGTLFSRGAGVLAAALSALASIWFMPPEGAFHIPSEGVVPFILFVLIALTCAVTLEALQEAVAETIDREARLNATIDALEESEEQKRMLLVELSHRIRNDLGALAGVLTLQSKAHPEAASALQAAATRVRVLGRVHSRLNQAGSSQVVVDARDFLTELGADLEGGQLGDASVHLTVEALSAPLPLETATSLGLIVNELVTNCAKYAFPDGLGAVDIAFERRGGDYVLTVADDGVGLNEQVRGTGLGTKIVRSLAAQLDGRFERRIGRPGTIATVTFPVPAPVPAPGPAPQEPSALERELA
jgi:two-component sensor histidine kinase